MGCSLAESWRGHPRVDQHTNGMLNASLEAVGLDLGEDALPVRGHRSTGVLQPARVPVAQAPGFGLGLHGPMAVHFTETEDDASTYPQNQGCFCWNNSENASVRVENRRLAAIANQHAAQKCTSLIHPAEHCHGLDYDCAANANGNDADQDEVVHFVKANPAAPEVTEGEASAKRHECGRAGDRPPDRERPPPGCVDRLLPRIRQVRLVHTPNASVDARRSVRHNQRHSGAAQCLGEGRLIWVLEQVPDVKILRIGQHAAVGVVRADGPRIHDLTQKFEHTFFPSVRHEKVAFQAIRVQHERPARRTVLFRDGRYELRRHKRHRWTYDLIANSNLLVLIADQGLVSERMQHDAPELLQVPVRNAPPVRWYARVQRSAVANFELRKLQIGRLDGSGA
mmetsp:Transcript_26534/g.79914  ORF Transcript_26534/g.79914 Transcript_26534/m.79914 type:complete len:396 (+) Transcript_26534:78-1265(+)